MKNKAITQTFRISEKAYQTVVSESTRQNFSQSAVLNRILIRYAEWDRFAAKHRLLQVTPQMVRSLVTALPEEELVSYGNQVGSQHGGYFLDSLGLARDVNGALGLLSYLSYYANWFIFENSCKASYQRVHLSHQLGVEWSIYLKSVITSLMGAANSETNGLECNDVGLSFILSPRHASTWSEGSDMESKSPLITTL